VKVSGGIYRLSRGATNFCLIVQHATIASRSYWPAWSK